MLPIIGIIAGSGELPFSIATSYASQGGKCYIAALEREANLQLLQDTPYQSFRIGMVGAIIEYFHKFNVQNVIFAGGIKRPNFWSIKVDMVGRALLARIIKQKFLGDDTILRIVADFLEKKGFKIISSQEILLDNLDDINIITKATPLPSDIIDIELGVKLLTTLSGLDVGQSVIIEDGYILGIEAAEGTDNLIKRCVELRKKPQGGVLVKMLKLDQDIRLDIPTIGPDTIVNLANQSYNGLAISKDKVIIINPKTTIELANSLGLFIVRV